MGPPDVLGQRLNGERATPVRITPEASFVEVWPGVAAELRRRLRGCAAPAHKVEDVIQDVAERALRRSTGFPTRDDLLRWAVRVGRNLLIDGFRKEARLDGRSVPDRPSAVDVGTTVEARLAVAAVRAALPQLREADRKALLATPVTEIDRPTQVRDAVRRFRARERLKALCGGVGAAIASLAGGLRRLRQGPVVVASVLVPVVFTFGVLHSPADGRDHLGPQVRRLHESRVTRSSSGGQVAVVRSVAAPSPTGPGRAGPRPARTDPSAGTRIPSHQVVVPTPAGPQPSLTGRDKRPDDHLVCVRAYVAGSACFDAPPLPTS